MLDLEIRCKCKICKEDVTIKSLSSDHDLYHMSDNHTRETPFFAYHHEGFNEMGAFASAQCETCGAEYTVITDIISVMCSIDDAEEKYFGNIQEEFQFKVSEITFPKWLKKQKRRGDTVGDLAKDAFYTDGLPRGLKKIEDREYPGRPKKATEYKEWIQFLHNKKDALIAFRMAWAEYKVLKEYGRV